MKTWDEKNTPASSSWLPPKREGGGRKEMEASFYFFSEIEKRSAANVAKLISGQVKGYVVVGCIILLLSCVFEIYLGE